MDCKAVVVAVVVTACGRSGVGARKTSRIIFAVVDIDIALVRCFWSSSTQALRVSSYIDSAVVIVCILAPPPSSRHRRHPCVIIVLVHLLIAVLIAQVGSCTPSPFPVSSLTRLLVVSPFLCKSKAADSHNIPASVELAASDNGVRASSGPGEHARSPNEAASSARGGVGYGGRTAWAARRAATDRSLLAIMMQASNMYHL